MTPPNRQIAVQDSNGGYNSTSYNPNDTVASTTNGDGDQTQFEYDDADQQIAVEDANGEVATTSYFPDGRIQSQTDPEGETTQFAYGDTATLLTVTAPANTNSRRSTKQCAYRALDEVVEPSPPVLTGTRIGSSGASPARGSVPAGSPLSVRERNRGPGS